MQKEDNQNWWQPAVMLFAQLSAWIAGPIIIAIYLGRWLDEKYNREPFFYFTCVGFAFLVSNVGIICNAVRAIKKMNQMDKKEKDSLGIQKEKKNRQL